MKSGVNFGNMLIVLHEEPTPYVLNHYYTILDINPILNYLKLLVYIKKAHFVLKCITEGGKRQSSFFFANVKQLLFLQDIDYFLSVCQIKIL